MITHIVCFKYKAETPEPARADHRDRLRGLKGLEEVVSLTVGADVVHSPRSYDTALVVLFEDRAGLETYQKNPQHVPVAQYGVSLCDSIVAVDFE